jgi:hypothetical protein
LIGGTGVAGVTCVDWLALELPNVADFDDVFVDSGTLTNLIEQANQGPGLLKEDVELLERNLSDIQTGLRKVLRSSGSVYGIVYPHVHLRLEGRYSPPSNSDWCPLPLSLKQEAGDTLTLPDAEIESQQPFTPYLDLVGRWGFVFDSHYSRDALKDAVKLQATDFGRTLQGYRHEAKADMTSMVLATDRQGNAVAIGLLYRLFVPKSVHGYSAQEVSHEAEPAFQSGPFYVFVPPTKTSSEEGIRVLLEDVCGIQAASLPPSWANEIPMPGDGELESDLEAGKHCLAQAQAAFDALEKRRAERDSFKAILYEDGGPLQETCRKTLEAMGIGTEPSPVSDEFMIEHEGQRALVEVSGSRKSVSLRDVSQLFKDIANYLHKTDEPIKGVFIGNPWRKVPPRERGSDDKPTFPPNVATFGEQHGIALLSTVELFSAYCTHLQGEVDTKTLFTWLMEGRGVLRMRDVPVHLQSAGP